MREVLAATKCRWLSRRQQQTLYMAAVNAVPVGVRVGGLGDLDDILFESEIAQLFWGWIVGAWAKATPYQDWAVNVLDDVCIDELVRRAIVLGQRPHCQDDNEQGWHVLRACAIDALLTAHRAAEAKRGGSERADRVG